ncbi:Ubiquitin-conjugating enzyme family protein [Leishmania donovani]|uniref:Ubiquitin-conjugating enzyme family protein n=1 Tax=Leishmania donovani TaxID=5661 RepID=A0A504XSS2_LEIDO|nr:Ubiquitin-conjugating enzyme family protein [Leishmania donovani]
MSYASSAIKRLSNEYRRLQKPENRVREYYIAPLEENIFEWHFTLRGPGGDDNSLPYKDGIYHGALIFSRSYPLEPPDILFFTRSGRFAVREKICSTISSYHKELWQPTYDIALTLTALRHFMAQEDEFGVGAFPKSMIALETKEVWAKETWSFTCSRCGMATKDVWETQMKMYPETSPEKEAQVPKLPLPPPAAPAASATAKPEDAGEKQDAPDTASSPAPPPSASPSSTLSPSPAAADASETAAKAAAAPDAPQSHNAPKGTPSSPAFASTAVDATALHPARVVRAPSLVRDTPRSEAGLAAAAAADATPPVTSAVADGVVAADVAGASASPLSTAAAAVAPPQFAQRVVFGVNIMEVSISLRLLDRAIIVSFLFVVLILLLVASADALINQRPQTHTQDLHAELEAMIKVEAAGSSSAHAPSLPTHTHVETRMLGQLPSQMASSSIEAWCDGVQHLMEKYFSRLGEVVVAHLGLRAPSIQDQHSSGGSGAAEKREIVNKLRSEHKENLELDVQAADIEATEMALFQQLWAHHQLQQKRQRPVAADDGTEKEDRLSGASRGGASTPDAVAEAALPTRDGASYIRPPSSSAAATAPEDAASATPCDTEGNPFLKTQQHLASESAARIPADLLELFRTAQELHSAAPGSTGPPPRATPSKEAAAAGENPFDATANRLSRVSVVLSEEENAQAAAMALLCFRYFYSSNSAPASPVEAAAPLVSATKPPSSHRSPPMYVKRWPPPLYSPGAWRKLITKPGSLGPSEHQQQPSSTPAHAADRLRAELASLFPQQAQQVQGGFSCGLPPQRAFFTGADTSVDADAAGEKSRPESKGRNNHVAFLNADRTTDGARGAGGRPPLTRPTLGSPSTEDAHNSGASRSKGGVKLPSLTLHASPTSAGERPPSAAASSSPPTPPTPTTAAAGTPHRRRAPRLLPKCVVLPPNYSGVHGEQLTMAQLVQLAAGVSEDCAVAQVDVKRQYDAADAAAAELYRLQQAVARVLLENIQLEKDIYTLTATSHAYAAGDEDGDADEAGRGADAAAGMRRRHHSDGVDPYGSRYSDTSKSRVRKGVMSCFAASTLSPASAAHPSADKRKRQPILPPAPMPLPHSKRALTAASLLLHVAGEKKAVPPVSAAAAAVAHPWPWRQESAPAERAKLSPKSSCQHKARAVASAIPTAAEGVTAVDGQQEPHTILQELRSAIASREAEKAQTLAEIDALSSRVTRHDTLLHAVAEYWRRNAAVMKRQHFAVQSQPKQSTSSETMTRLGDGGDGWGSENAIGTIAPPCLFNASDGTHGVVTQANSSNSGHSTSSHKYSHSTVITAAMSLSGKMTNLGGSPSQAQRALAQMEALSPTPLSSTPSFDMRITSPVSSTLSPPLQMRALVRRQIIPPRQRAQESEPAPNKPDAINATLSAATGAAVEAESTPVRVRVGVHVTPPMENELGGRPHRKVIAPPLESPTAAAAAVAPSSTFTDTDTTATTFLRSPDSVSDTMGRSPSASAALTVGAPAVLKQEWRKNEHGLAVSAVAVNLFNGSPRRWPGNILASPLGFTQVYDREEGEDDNVCGSGSFPTTPLHPSRSTTANNSHSYAIGGMRRGDEDVLDHGSWRTIPALQLENVDEIAEFIYSVFERP